MTTDFESNNRVDTGWERARNVIGVGILMLLSYQMGAAHARADKTRSDYSAATAQYQRIEAEYSALRAQYDGIMPQYAAMRERCENTTAEYAALKAQYDRIEARRTGNLVNKSNQ